MYVYMVGHRGLNQVNCTVYTPWNLESYFYTLKIDMYLFLLEENRITFFSSFKYLTQSAVSSLHG